jgi:hypothetical protein
MAGPRPFRGYAPVVTCDQEVKGVIVSDPSTASAAKARQGLAIYFPVLILTSGIVEWLIVRHGDAQAHHPALMFVLMWMPAFSSVVARLSLREGIRDVSFRRWRKNGARCNRI